MAVISCTWVSSVSTGNKETAGPSWQRGWCWGFMWGSPRCDHQGVWTSEWSPPRNSWCSCHVSHLFGLSTFRDRLMAQHWSVSTSYSNWGELCALWQAPWNHSCSLTVPPAVCMLSQLLKEWGHHHHHQGRKTSLRYHVKYVRMYRCTGVTRFSWGTFP